LVKKYSKIISAVYGKNSIYGALDLGETSATCKIDISLLSSSQSTLQNIENELPLNLLIIPL